ncbi:MAG: DUF4422 domain-containing protein [Alphaproteobacteria bacterium]|nr:DUF4422 domain-containing protein [Alphaproteobacteria bacterium]
MIKIFITHKDKHNNLVSDIITSIQTGRVFAAENFDNMLGDDTGDNISFLNPTFCELSAIYWVWKNQDKINLPDYIGFMHYRRHFLFGNKEYNPNYFGLVKFSELNSDYLENDLTSDKNITKICTAYDAIIPQKIDVTTLGKDINNYDHYKNHHNIKDYDKVIEIISDKYPEYLPFVEKYNISKYGYFLNMFIFKKEIFNEYCTWLFDILFELYNNIQISQTDSYQQRTIGFISERLTAIYIYKLLSKDYKTLELPVSFIEHETIIKPVSDNVIPIVVSSSNLYVPFLSVLLESIKDTANSKYIYEINVLEQNISTENKLKIKKQYLNSNIKIKFINLGKSLDELKKIVESKHYSEDTFSRLFIPKLIEHDKCIYLDIDTIVLKDLKDLYDTDLEDYYVAACKDPLFTGMTSGDKNLKKYVDNVLRLDDYRHYFQAGVMVMNLKKMRENDITNLCLDTLMSVNFRYADQCCLNYLLKNNVKYIDISWNYQVYFQQRQFTNLKFHLSVNDLQKYYNAYLNPRIIHYSGKEKPWFYPDAEYADIWWKYARNTPFYEVIIARMIDAVSQYNTQLVYIINNLLYFRIKKFWSQLKKNLTFGKRRQRYKDKYERIKQLIKDAKKFKKQILK